MSEVEPPIVRPAKLRRLDLPVGRDPHSVRRRIEGLEYTLERLVTVPVIGRKVGLDSILGLIPVGGDLVTAALGAYLVWEARNLGLPRWKLIRMAGNVAFDSALGAIPVAGDLFDFVFRSNSRNLRMLKRHLDKHHPLIEQ
ncbi:MAG: hypothetical protein B7Z08_06795 [Sphingomonadales bacterium 32-68-7]|nr:MAG: hypothetical protein B7Z33_09845 [Sphingomonadales bacterium 12-68-11]OYX09080.1 MAG: hypothetical protein B7Z08_06795 [Sphingomonadales bacterium 32-68-7]